MAVAWKDKKMKCIVATTGTTLEGNAIIKPRSKVVTDENTGLMKTQKYNKRVPCPVVFNQLFNGFNAIDVYDHYRQGTLALEVHNKTHI